MISQWSLETSEKYSRIWYKQITPDQLDINQFE